MLDAMCAFLVSGEPRFVHDGHGKRLAFSDYLDWRQVRGREAAIARTGKRTAG